MLCWLSPLTELRPSCVAGGIGSLSKGPRDNDEDVWLAGLAEPFIVPAMEVRGALGGSPIEVRFVGGSIDFRAVVGPVVTPILDLAESVDGPSCLVGDLFGDLDLSA